MHVMKNSENVEWNKKKPMKTRLNTNKKDVCVELSDKILSKIK